MTFQRVLRGAVAMSILGLLIGAGDLKASAFTVTPVRVLLSPGTSSALLTVRNDSTELIRFQISLRAWNLSPDGDMQLTETKDLVFFPAMMELKPAEERKVRIGSAFKAAVPTERSYRIFFEELPPAQVATAETAGAQVRVLTKMGIPIFIQPASLVIKADLTNVSAAQRKVSFDVQNAGNTFFTVTNAKITGTNKTGVPTFTKQLDGWYVLAGGTRHFQFEIPADACTSSDRFKLEVSSSLTDEKGNPSSLTQELNAAQVCGAAAPK
jgi:fimbrial chaperone protein